MPPCRPYLSSDRFESHAPSLEHLTCCRGTGGHEAGLLAVRVLAGPLLSACDMSDPNRQAAVYLVLAVLALIVLFRVAL